MAGVNKVIIIGNLGSDPELRYTQDGTAVARLSVATTRTWNNKQTNEKQQETEWHRITVWGNQAENCQKYLEKGRQVYVEGYLRTSSYDDKETGQKRYSTEIVAEKVQFLGGNPQGSESRDSDQEEKSSSNSSRRQTPSGGGRAATKNTRSADPDDDIPF